MNLIPDRLLLYPPFADPTQPYISLPTLKGYLKRKNMDAKVIDINMEATHFLLAPQRIAKLHSVLEQRFIEFNRKPSLSFLEQWEYEGLANARKILESFADRKESLVKIFQNPDSFYEYSLYSWAREKMDGLFDAISSVSFPYQYHFNKAGHFLIPWSFEMLDAYCDEKRSPLHDFYEGYFQNRFSSVDFIGISLTFVSQIPEAFYLCRSLRSFFPNAFFMLGGSCLHQILSYAKEKTLHKLFSYVDAACIGEGEETLAELFPLLPQWQKVSDTNLRLKLIENVPNLLLWDSHTKKVHTSPFWMADLQDPAMPDFTDLALDNYLAPGRILLYAPTRGCYWNKCSFCDYGFSRLSSHRYREIPAEIAASQLETLSCQYSVENFYLSCDVLAPAYALKLAEQILQKDISIHWNTDLRIEKYYTIEQCHRLYKSGLRAVAFGVESGSDQMLRCMNKGLNTKLIEEINRNFHDAGISTAWMAFHYHPGENLQEAMKTIDWIAKEKSYVDLFIVGEFGLTSRSDIAHNPSKYGLDNIYYFEGDEFKLYPSFQEKNKKASRNNAQILDKELSRVASTYTLMHYPWAGAISTHHTFLYLLRFGQRAFAGMFKKHRRYLPKTKNKGHLEKERYSLKEIDRRKDSFLRHYQKLALTPDISMTAPLSFTHFLQEAKKWKELMPSSASVQNDVGFD